MPNVEVRLMSEQPIRVAAAERGVALILTLIFTVLLYALVADLVTTARTARLTGENSALTARMDNHMSFTLGKIEEMLLNDLAAGAAAGDDGGEGMGAAGGGLPGGLGGALPGGGGEEGGEEAETDPSAESDGSRDAWYEPTAYADSDITTYVWVEDENSKFNLHTLVSPDDEFADASRERFVRLLDGMREDTDWDLTTGEAEAITDNILDWLNSRVRTEEMPRPELKSDAEFERSQISLILHLDELLLLRDIDRELFFDKVLDGRKIPGLESLLTVYTSNVFDPGDPNDPNTRQEAESEDGEAPAEPEAPVAEQPRPGDEPMQPEGVGIRININTAPREVLRALFTTVEMSDTVLDAILRFRNEPEENEDGELLESQLPDDYLGLVEPGSEIKRKVFTSMDQLEEIPEFMNLPDPTVKDRFYELCGVTSDVFSIHMASVHVRNEERRVFVLRRRRSVVVRIDDGGDGKLHPLILLESRNGLRVKGEDFLDDSELDRFAENDSMDVFSQEEKAWNPFLLDFYLPDEERQRLYSYR